MGVEPEVKENVEVEVVNGVFPVTRTEMGRPVRAVPVGAVVSQVILS